MGKFKDPFLMKSPLNAYADGNDGRKSLPTADLYNDMLGKIADATNSIVKSRKTSNAQANAKTDSELKSEEASKDIKRITDMTYEERMEESGTGFGKKKPSLFGGNFSV